MRLSEAIRLGAMALPEAHGPVIRWEERDGRYQPCGACLLGSVRYAIGFEMGFTEYMNGGNGVYDTVDAIVRRWPWTAAEVACPVDGSGGANVPMRAMLLYEFSGWSRERIANWIETMEAPSEQSVTTSTDAEQGHLVRV